MNRRKEVQEQVQKVAKLHRELMIATAKGNTVDIEKAFAAYREAKECLKRIARGK